MTPPLCVVILTWNEEGNIGDCLRSLARQTDTDFETLVLDAGSRDRTVAEAKEAGAALPGGIRIHAGDHMPIGAARNLAVRLTDAPLVAYVSADVELHPAWTQRARKALAGCDMAFGRQVHAPRRRTVASAVRGIRYRFPEVIPDEPVRFASNVAGVFRREIIERFPFDDEADAAEDLVMALEAQEAGFTACYDPKMVVFHHDVETPRQEFRKTLREGAGWAAYRRRLGLHGAWLAWGAALPVPLVLLPWSVVAGVAGFAVVLWAPSIRRAMRHHPTMHPLDRAKAVVVSPAYDLAFLATYLRGLTRPPRTRRTTATRVGL